MINWKQRYAIAPHADYDRIEHMTPRDIMSNYNVRPMEHYFTLFPSGPGEPGKHNPPWNKMDYYSPTLGTGLEDDEDYDLQTERPTTKKWFWVVKREESRRLGLYDDIKKNGLQKPIAVVEHKGTGEKYIYEGHHRLISCHDLDPDKPIPVKILTSFPDEHHEFETTDDY